MAIFKGKDYISNFKEFTVYVCAFVCAWREIIKGQIQHHVNI